jgi:hypothetical protein
MAVKGVNCDGCGAITGESDDWSRPIPAIRVPNYSPLSCRSGIGEHLPFAHGLVCKILITAWFVA